MPVVIVRAGPSPLPSSWLPILNGSQVELESDWVCLPGRLLSSLPPSALIIQADALTSDAVILLASIQKRGLLPPTGIYFTQLTHSVVDLAWCVAALGAVLLDDSPARLANLISEGPNRIAVYVQRSLQFQSRAVVKLYALLAEKPDLLTAPPASLAKRVGVARATLYSLLDAAGSPPAEHIQALFRLVRAAQALQRGATVDDAAHLAAYADASALKKALARRLDTSITEIKSRPGWTWLVDKWLQLDRANGRSNFRNRRANLFGTDV